VCYSDLFQMAAINRRLCKEVETIFLMPDEQYTYLSSSIVKEVSSLNGPVDKLVPPLIKAALNAKFNR
jgi:pantetheine-phosphate adenylyltransferase